MVGQSAMIHTEAGKHNVERWPLQLLALASRIGLVETVSGRTRPAIWVGAAGWNWGRIL